MTSDDVEIRVGDCVEIMSGMMESSVDAIVTDPPYNLTANKKGGTGIASLNLNHPGGRSRITTGFMGKPWDGDGVSFNRNIWAQVLRIAKPGAHLVAFGGTRTFHRLACAIEDAGFEIRDCLSWIYGTGFPKSLNFSEGRGTALKPAWEPIILARKPLDGTVKANAEKHGTGGLNINACRVDLVGVEEHRTPGAGAVESGFYREGNYSKNPYQAERMAAGKNPRYNPTGRWPANLVIDEEAAAMLDKQIGGASRFFYCAKASRKERGEGNNHPTVKPVALIRWLVRLVTPPNGLVLDPFVGSGTTGIACLAEGKRFVGIEKQPEYVEIAKRRIAAEIDQ